MSAMIVKGEKSKIPRQTGEMACELLTIFFITLVMMSLKVLNYTLAYLFVTLYFLSFAREPFHCLMMSCYLHMYFVDTLNVYGRYAILCIQKNDSILAVDFIPSSIQKQERQSK